MIRRGASGRGSGGVATAAASVAAAVDEEVQTAEEGTEIDDSVKRRSLHFDEWKRKKDEEKNDAKVSDLWRGARLQHTALWFKVV